MIVRTGTRRIHYDLAGPSDAPVVCLAHSLSSDSGVSIFNVNPFEAMSLTVAVEGSASNSDMARPMPGVRKEDSMLRIFMNSSRLVYRTCEPFDCAARPPVVPRAHGGKRG